MSRHVLIALSAGALSAVVSLTFLSGSPGGLLFVYLAPFPLFVVGLSLGVSAGIIASASGLVIATFLGGAFAALIFGILHALPAILATRQALQTEIGTNGTVSWYPAGFVLAGLAVLATILFTAAAIAVWGAGETLTTTIADTLGRTLNTYAPMIPITHREQLLAGIIPYFPGLVGVSWIMIAAFNGTAAQALVKRAGKNIRPSVRLADLKAPAWIAWAVVASAVLALIAPGDLNYVARNVVVILAVPYFFMGLSVTHALAKRLSFPVVFLVAFYLSLIISVWVVVFVACIGAIEHWIGLRHRFAGPDPDDEEEE
jgi:hypothetical protein